MIEAFNKDLPYDQFIREQIAGGFAACGESGSGLSLGAFIAFGIAGGTLLKAVRAEHLDGFMQWTAILGFGMVLSAQYFSNLPYTLYAKSEIPTE